jgi:hypothetical protein
LSSSSGNVASLSTGSSSKQDSATNYIIPFVRDTQNYVNAAMFIKTDKGDTSISYLCDWQYSKFRTPAQISQANDIAIFFMLFDRKVYGHQKFDVLDSALFRKNNKKAITISFKNTDSSNTNGFSTYTCTSYTITYYHCPAPVGSCNGYQGECDGCFEYCRTDDSFTICNWVASVSPPGNDFGGGGTPPPDNGSGSNIGGSGNNDVAVPPSNNDGLRPGWKGTQSGGTGRIKKPVLLDLEYMYEELNGQIDNKEILNLYKLSFFSIEEMYYEKAISNVNRNLYSNLSSKEFIELIKLDSRIALTIDPITLLAKAGACGAADIIVQMFFARMLDDNITTWNQALQRVDWWQVGYTMATGVLPISNKYIIAAIAGGGVALKDLTDNGFSGWERLGIKFVEGFMGGLIGTSLGGLVSEKFGTLSNLGKKLVTKFDGVIGYASICKWLGGGISNVSESLLTNKGIIASSRKIIGWGGPDKVAVIGRYMEDRVIPYANKMGAAYFDKNNPIAAPYFTQEVLDNIRDLNRDHGNNWPINVVLSSKLYKANQQFILDLKKMGYTFIDLGGPSGSDFYNMEIKEIFD